MDRPRLDRDQDEMITFCVSWAKELFLESTSHYHRNYWDDDDTEWAAEPQTDRQWLAYLMGHKSRQPLAAALRKAGFAPKLRDAFIEIMKRRPNDRNYDFNGPRRRLLEGTATLQQAVEQLAELKRQAAHDEQAYYEGRYDEVPDHEWENIVQRRMHCLVALNHLKGGRPIPAERMRKHHAELAKYAAKLKIELDCVNGWLSELGEEVVDAEFEVVRADVTNELVR